MVSQLTRKQEAKQHSEWSITSLALLRTTGFPFELLEELQAVDFYQELSAALLQESHKEKVQWDALTEQFDRHRRTCIQKLIDIGKDDRFLEAVFLSSTNIYTHLASWLANYDNQDEAPSMKRKDRRLTQKLVLYLQRFCTKNESMSFFGPTFWAKIQGETNKISQLPWHEEAPRRAVFWSHWAAHTLAIVMEQDCRIWAALVPQRPAALFTHNDQYHKVHFSEYPNTVEKIAAAPQDAEQHLLNLCDGCRSIAEIANLYSHEMVQPQTASFQEVADRLRALEQQGLLEIKIVIPVGLPQPIEALQAFVRSCPEDARQYWLPILNQLDAQRLAFAQARSLDERVKTATTLNEMFTQYTHETSSRGAGELAADRSIIFEDCYRRLDSFILGGSVAKTLQEQFPRVLDLIFQLPLARLRIRKQVAWQWFHKNFGSLREVPLDTVLAVAQHSDLENQLLAADEEQRHHGYSYLCDMLNQTDQQCIQIDPQQIEKEVQHMQFDNWTLCSADVHIGAQNIEQIQAGAFTIVLGEVHALNDLMAAGPQMVFLPQEEGHLRQIEDYTHDLSHALVCEPVLTHNRKQSIRATSHLPVVEFIGRASGDEKLKIQAHELSIRDMGQRIALWHPLHGEIELTQPPLDAWYDEERSIFGAFSGLRIVNMSDLMRPTWTGHHLPRIQVGNIIVLRETWWADPLPNFKWTSMSFHSQKAVIRLQQSLQLPSCVYAHFEEEQKPIFIDFHNPLLIDLFARQWAMTSAPVRISEMVPGPHELWLKNSKGRYTSEFRIGYYRAQQNEVPLD